MTIESLITPMVCFIVDTITRELIAKLHVIERIFPAAGGDNCSIPSSDENILIIVSNDEAHHASCISVTHSSNPILY